jgi:hypothetical protein
VQLLALEQQPRQGLNGLRSKKVRSYRKQPQARQETLRLRNYAHLRELVSALCDAPSRILYNPKGYKSRIEEPD